MSELIRTVAQHPIASIIVGLFILLALETLEGNILNAITRWKR